MGNGTGSILNSAILNFNTWMQDIPIAVGRSQGISYAPAGEVLSASYNNNTAVVVPGAYINIFMGYDLTWQISSTLQYNFVAGVGQSNGGGGGFSLNYIGAGPYKGAMTISNNVNMLTGTAP
jgi:hypothetical protein